MDLLKVDMLNMLEITGDCEIRLQLGYISQLLTALFIQIVGNFWQDHPHPSRQG